MADASTLSKGELPKGAFYTNSRAAASGADHLQPARMPKGMPRGPPPRAGMPPARRPPTFAEAMAKVEFDPKAWTDEARHRQLEQIRRFRGRNALTAVGITACIVGIYFYTIQATKQEDLDKLPLPVKKES